MAATTILVHIGSLGILDSPSRDCSNLSSRATAVFEYFSVHIFLKGVAILYDVNVRSKMKVCVCVRTNKTKNANTVHTNTCAITCQRARDCIAAAGWLIHVAFPPCRDVRSHQYSHS